MKVTVEKKKKSVVVLDWGHAPFAVQEKQGRRVYIPDGFTVETFCFNKSWIGQTSVRGDVLQYQFFLKSEPHKSSGWQKSASAALAVANERIKNRFYKPGSNGALVIGVTYPNLQDEITRRFGSKLDKSGQSSEEEDEEDEQEEAMEDDENARAPQFAFEEDVCCSSNRAQPKPRYTEHEEMSQEAEGLEPISLAPFNEESLVFRDEYFGACGSLDADLKVMESIFHCKKANLATSASSVLCDFNSSSFEDSQDAELFLGSNYPLELDTQ
jgi:hypothetical protein